MKTFLFLNVFLFCLFDGEAQKKDELAQKIDHYLQPLAATNNFSGTVLIARKGEILFQKAYGFANQAWKVPNTLNSVYHIASVSKTFTAAAILMLEQKGLLTTKDLLSAYIPDYPFGDKITIHHLLSHTSGITDINDLPEYKVTLHQHQDLQSLIALFKDKPLEFQPGEKYGYSSANYNLLAFIIEKVSGEKYGAFLAKNIFIPLKMNSTFHDDDAQQIIVNEAEGYEQDAKFGFEKPHFLDWSSKTGGGSLASTAGDLFLWDRALYEDDLLSPGSKTKMFTEYADSGYGWYIGRRYEKEFIYMNGDSPGFSSHLGRYPEEKLCVIVLENTVRTARIIGFDLAGIALNQPIKSLALRSSKLDKSEYGEILGQYKFDSNFYRPDFLMTVSEKDGFIYTDWGILIPEKPAHFIQRSYWSKISFEKDESGKVSKMNFDKFSGKKVK